jgi:hypothetical protein
VWRGERFGSSVNFDSKFAMLSYFMTSPTEEALLIGAKY